MKIGSAYRRDNSLFIPLSGKTIDNVVLLLRLDFDPKAWAEKPYEPVINATTYNAPNQPSITTKTVNQEITNKIDFIARQIDQSEQSKYTPLYQPRSVVVLGAGDKWIDNKRGKLNEYTVLGFMAKEVSTDPIKANSPKEKRLYPYGIDLKPILDYVELAENSKNGLIGLFKNGNFKDGLEDTVYNALTSMWESNSQLTFWSSSMPRPASVVYLKQEKPELTIKPLVFKEPTVMGDKQSSLLPTEYFDRDGINYTYLKDNDIVKPDAREIFGLNNFVNYQYPNFPKTGNIFFDDFYFMEITENSDNSTNTPFTGSKSVWLVSKNQNKIRVGYDIELGMCGYYLTGSVSRVSLNLDWLFQVTNYASNELTLKNSKSLLSVDMLNCRPFDGTYRSKSITTPIYYIGQGRFTCLQGEDTQKDILGVGDKFDLTLADGQNTRIIIGSYFGYNKNAELIKFHYIANYNSLIEYSENKGDVKAQVLTEEVILKNMYNHESFLEARQRIKNFYLQETGVSTGKPAASPYQSLRDLIGQEYDDYFLSGVSGLDWDRIRELKNKEPDIILPIREIIKQAYVEYLIEKASKPQKQVGTGKINSGKFFWMGEQYYKDRFEKQKTDLENKLGQEFVENNMVYSTKGQAPSVSLAEIPNIFNKAFEIPSNASELASYEYFLYATFQENKEPLLLQKFRYRYINGNAIYMQVFDYESPYLSNYDTYNKDYDYYRILYGFQIMFHLWAVHYGENINTDIVRKAEYKRIFPCRLNDIGINFLKYMNRWGFFDTPENMYDKLWAACGQDASNMNFHRYLSSNMFNTLFTSQSSSAKYLSKNISNLLVMELNNYEVSRGFFADKQRVIDYFNSLPIDWGNTEAPYMAQLPTVATTTTTTTRKKRTPKAKPQPPVVPPQSKFEWVIDYWRDINNPITDKEFNDHYGLPADFKKQAVEFKYEGKEWYLIRWTPKEQGNYLFGKLLSNISDYLIGKTTSLMTEILEIYKLPELEDKLNESKDNTLLIFLPKEFGHEFSTNFTISSSFIQPPAPKPKPEPPKPKPEPPKPKPKPEPPKPKVAKPKKPKEVQKAIEDLDTLDFNF
jgi:hypothetical protein